MKIKLIFGFLVLLLSACRPPIEEVSRVDPNYSIADVASFMVTLDCDDTDITELKNSYVKNYCELLKHQISSHIQQQHSDWELVELAPDLLIEATLDQLYGGNQALRFFMPLEAGRTMLTLHFLIYKQKVLMAERRVTEITRRIHFEDEMYTNEDAIEEDTKIIANYVSDYIQNPNQFDLELKEYRNGYTPH